MAAKTNTAAAPAPAPMPILAPFDSPPDVLDVPEMGGDVDDAGTGATEDDLDEVVVGDPGDVGDAGAGGAVDCPGSGITVVVIT